MKISIEMDVTDSFPKQHPASQVAAIQYFINEGRWVWKPQTNAADLCKDYAFALISNNADKVQEISIKLAEIGLRTIGGSITNDTIHHV